MHLRSGGMDVFYVDESHDRDLYAVTAVAVPFLRNEDGLWNLVWPDHLSAAKEWRSRVSKDLKIPVSKELHGVKLGRGEGNYCFGKRNLTKAQSISAYRDILASIYHITSASVITVVGERGHTMYGNARLQRVMHALFQRMRAQCAARNVNAMTFFDQGHPEYRDLYRQAQVYLPTGSQQGGWGDKPSKSIPLDMFLKDANEKNSKHCLFTQTADLIAYAAFQKIRSERGMLSPEQKAAGLDGLYDVIPRRILNLRASSQEPKDAIVRLR